MTPPPGKNRGCFDTVVFILVMAVVVGLTLLALRYL